MTDFDIIGSVRLWVERFVIGEGLCPFARQPLEADRVRFALSRAQDEDTLLEDLADECFRLCADPAMETSLLIHPWVLTDFHDYNQFLDAAEGLLRARGLEGELQIASFHPDYQFANTQPDDAGNYTNRSPYPMLHVLRESSVASAVDHFENVDRVPARNTAKLSAIGAGELHRRWLACFVADESD